MLQCYTAKLKQATDNSMAVPGKAIILFLSSIPFFRDIGDIGDNTDEDCKKKSETA